MQSHHEEDRQGNQNLQGNLDEMSMAELLEQSFEDIQPVERGSTIQGTVVSISSGEILVNIGSKYEGIIRSRDLDKIDPSYLDGLSEGDDIRVYVLHLEDEEGYVELSLSRALVEEDWDRAQEAHKQGDIFEGTVVSTNKGGLIVNYGSVRGFVPGSQLASQNMSRSDKSNQWANLIGQAMMLKIIEVDRRRNRLILSERQAMDEQRKEQKKRLLEEIKEGDVRKGRISSLADFGAFVDLGGAEGLVHLSELAWVQVSHPKEVLKVGEEVDVYVLSVDLDRQRIGLSIKHLLPEPWTEFIENYTIDQVVPAIITKLTTFGAFARIDNVLEGLIHISELSHRPINHPREVVSEGDEVEVCIISIDPHKRRMGLSLKQASQPEVDWVDADETLGDEGLEDEDDSEADAEESEQDETKATAASGGKASSENEASSSSADGNSAEETNPQTVTA